MKITHLVLCEFVDRLGKKIKIKELRKFNKLNEIKTQERLGNWIFTCDPYKRVRILGKMGIKMASMGNTELEQL